MGTIVNMFGKTVGNFLPDHPERALGLLKAGYRASGLQMKYLPAEDLLPNQKYLSVMSNKAIRRPLEEPTRSAVVNVFLPCELLHAMDIAPQFTEGLSCYLNGAACERPFIDYAELCGVPQTYCSYHKTLLGAALSGVLPPPRFVASTTLACDANANTFRTIAELYKVPYFTVDVPNVRGEESVAYVSDQLREFSRFVEDVMREKLDPGRLRAAMGRANRSMSAYRAYYDLLAEKYIPNDMTSEMYRIFPTHILLGTEEAERYFDILLDDAKNAAPAGGQLRLLWVHSLPYWQDSLRGIINFSRRYQLLCADLNFDSMADAADNDPYRSMARRIVSNILNGPGELRAQKVLEMARSCRADGVVYFCHWGCKHTLGGARYAKDVIEGGGIPVLILDGDGCDRGNVNDGQMKTRFQAFIEMLEASK